jgi:polyisoprenoid-binding protein YceI
LLKKIRANHRLRPVSPLNFTFYSFIQIMLTREKVSGKTRQRSEKNLPNHLLDRKEIMNLRNVFLLIGTVLIMAGCGEGEPAESPAAQPEANVVATQEAPPAAPATQVAVEPTAETGEASPGELDSVDQATDTEEMDDAKAAVEDTETEDRAADEETADDAEMENAPPGEEVAADDTGTQSVEDIRTFIIVPDQTQASYIVEEEFFGGSLDRLGIEPGLVDTIGRTQEVSGQMVLDFNNLAQPVVSSEFSVDLQSLTSDQPRRDNRIREANLESNRFPLATFTISSIENGPASYAEGEEVTFQAIGEITIREITRPATFDVTAKLAGNTITGIAQAPLKMTDFGFDPPNFANLFSVEDEFIAEVEFSFQEGS